VRRTLARHAGALLLFAAVVVVLLWPLLERGIDRAVLYPHLDTDWQELPEPVQGWQRADITFTAALVARNAWAVARHPHRIFDAEHCAPSRSTLALTDPVISLGLLGVPAQLATGDAILTYNLALASLLLLSAFAMYLLVYDWTRVHVAGLVAGLFFAFGLEKIQDIGHPFVYDTSWIVLAWLFARRLFAFGRWWDALGLALSGSLQLATAFYPALGALLLSLPLGGWLLWHHGLSSRRMAQLGVVVAVVLLAAAWVYSPYLELRSAGLGAGMPPIHGSWSQLLPGRIRGVAWSAALLALAGLVAPRAQAFGRSDADPRWAILAGSLLAVGGSTETVYSALASLLPGLDLVRVPARVAATAQTGVALLAGIGAAALLRTLRARAPRVSAAAAAGLVAAASIELLLVPTLRAPQGRRYAVLEVRPRPEELELFHALAQMGNSGPVLELPFVDLLESSTRPLNPGRILRAAYHHRRTSACFASLRPREFDLLSELIGGQLPNYANDFPARELAQLGFTTVVVDSSTLWGDSVKRLVQDEIASGSGSLELLHEAPPLAAYSLSAGKGW
jgi:hypothetical protein